MALVSEPVFPNIGREQMVPYYCSENDYYQSLLLSFCLFRIRMHCYILYFTWSSSLIKLANQISIHDT
jgi:hypothetical protein